MGSGGWGWIWPDVGATPISQGLDSEMFDRSDYPYSETFVREAIQNSLDARLNEAEPVLVRFRFHSDKLGDRRGFLEDVFEFRKRAQLPAINDWSNDEATWLTVEDCNAKGLAGDLSKRTGDFWNYWLNFGLSNKDGSGRGGRGIGRVTFLISSRINTVIGYTRRQADGVTAACGMSVLKPIEEGDKLRSTHAYMASNVKGTIYDLHGPEVHGALETAFGFAGFANPDRASGLALAIMYPHEDLTADGILAAAIEHFAPAVMSGALVLEVDDTRLDRDTIPVVAAKVSDRFSNKAIKADPGRYLALIKSGLSAKPLEIDAQADGKPGLGHQAALDAGLKIQKIIEQDDHVVLDLRFPLELSGQQLPVSLRAILARAPHGKAPIDRLFREGMALPDVKTRFPGEFDLVVLVEDKALATYLNFCEGKAHLDLLQSKEITQKLAAKGYKSYRVKNFVKTLPYSIRQLATPDTSQPDASVFDNFFSIPSDDPGKRKGPGGAQPNKDIVLPPVGPFPPPKPRVFRVETLADGLKLRANPEYKDWPANVSVEIAYADGSKKPSWSEFDFKVTDLTVQSSNCIITHDKNRIRAEACGPETVIEVTGFDGNRELDANIRVKKNA
jgi:hypothetical protein